MAKQSKARKRTVAGRNGKAVRKARKPARAVAPALGADEVKHLLRAPSDYKDIARKFADALDTTKLRATVSATKLRSMVLRSERLVQRADALQVKATAADRRRMLQDSQTWKSIMSAWRLVNALMPDHPELEQPFAFMQDYMSMGRNTPAPLAPSPSPSNPVT